MVVSANSYLTAARGLTKNDTTLRAPTQE
jgi:hypothetical protein